MFAGMTMSLPQSGAPEKRLERLARDKHSSFLQKFVNYDRKKFNRIGFNNLVFFVFKSSKKVLAEN